MTHWENIIKKHTLGNAITHSGTANPGNIMGKLFKDIPDAKKHAKELSQLIKTIVAGVNELSLEQQKAELDSIDPDYFDNKPKRREGLKELKNAEKEKVITRFAPSPSGPLHIGHAFSIAINNEYAKMYDGKLVLRIEDTNSANLYPDAYEMIERDANWLTDNNIGEFVIQSDRLELYYDYALKLIDQDKLYVCECENFKQFADEKTECPCRAIKKEIHAKRWHDMFNPNKCPEGSFAVRFKGDMTHKNPAMRDFPLFRISDIPHPRKGKEYRVWPLMNFAVAIDDMELGITHAIRAKEHMTSAERQKLIHEALDVPTPETLFTGRINFEGLAVSCSKTKALIDEGTIKGWDDIRIPFLLPLKKRGYQREALIRFALEIGVTQTDKKVKGDEFFKTINAFNKDIIDPTSNRYSVIKDPVLVEVAEAPEVEVTMHLHPSRKDGKRQFNTSGRFYLDKEDIDKTKTGEEIRLKDCLNIQKTPEGNFVFTSEHHDAFKGKRLVHWVSDDATVQVEVLMPDGSMVKGIGEKYLNNVKAGETVQFERFGFVTCVDDAHMEDGKQLLKFWYLHE